MSSSNQLFLSVLETSLSKICTNLIENSSKFLDLLLVKSIDSSLIKFRHTRCTLPIVLVSPIIVLGSDECYMKIEDYTSDGQPLQFLQSYCKINMNPGSLESMQLITSIIKTKNDNIFDYKFIQIILGEKWKKVRKVLYLQTGFYISYLILLSAYSSLEMLEVLYATFALNVLLTMYEFGQMYTGGLGYFTDPWNIFDLLRSALCTLMFLQDLLNFGIYSDFLVAVVLFFSWI